MQELKCQTAEEFWAVLDPKRCLLRTSGSLLYRGQRDASWSLRPSIHRRNNAGIEGTSGSDDIVLTEALYLISFLDHCSSIGMSVPGDIAYIRDQHLNFSARLGVAGAAINTTLWPPKELFTYLALAQHYQMPTRLLDWSTRSYVAAFFAAVDACRTSLPEPSTNQQLAVWVLSTDGAGIGIMPELEIVQVPGSHNRNMAAQGGVFTPLRQKGVRGKPFEGTAFLDEYMSGNELRSQHLLKVTLPLSEAPELLNLCQLHGITNSSLFPDYYGAARAALDDMEIHSYAGGLSKPKRWPKLFDQNLESETILTAVNTE